MASTSGCVKAIEVDLVGRLSPAIGIGDEEDIVAELVEWPRLKGSRVEYPMGCSQFREFCKSKSSVDRIRGYAFGYRGNFFRTYSVRQGGDYLYLLPNLAKEKKYRHLGDEVSLEYVQGMVKGSRTDGFCYYLTQFDYGLTLPLSNLAKSVMNMIGVCPTQLNCNFWEVILVCETLNERWATSGSESRITAKDFLEYYAVNGVSVERQPFMDAWWMPLVELNNKTITKGISCKVSGKESFIDSVAKEGTELEVTLKMLGINRFKMVASKDGKVVLEESVKISEGADLRPRFEVETGLMVEQCRAKAREKGVTVVEDEFKKFARALRGVHLGLQNRCIELERRISQLGVEKKQFEESLTREREASQLELDKEREAAALKLKEVRAESVAETERLVSASATSRNNHAGKLYQLRYTKAEIMAFSEGNYEEKKIVNEEEDEEMEDGLNVAEKTVIDNQEIIDQVLICESLLTVMLKELDVAREREEQTLLYNTKYAEENEALISQYKDRLDHNVKLSQKLEGGKGQVEDNTATLLCRDLALNQLISELAELMERAASGSRHDVELPNAVLEH
ncbi:hypothetical protein GIB67_041381 [Kingdonia uniflora]|uniref:Uncharacterized protein n=1 Tax=Kingdonia uniflora TaxID=39325 RepID=A0A7J7LRA6_9MAGN|nr:hypothetical protein GIB67_041381 [Kingdonia uniflora]